MSSNGEKLGILLVNLGSPAAPRYGEVRAYLKEFLSDRRVIQLNPILWQPILNLFILSFRPLKTARLYEKIWNKRTDESPLIFHSRETAEALRKVSSAHMVEWAMRYGSPAIVPTIERMESAGCEKIVLLPLYPQFSHTTTSSIQDVVKAFNKGRKKKPAPILIESYHDDGRYIEALARSVEDHVGGLDFTPEKIIVTFHGIPQSYDREGDPYVEQCKGTFALLAEKLPFDQDDILLTYQSRFGPQKWMEPYVDETLERLAKEGVKNVLLIAPGFAADCIETLEELDIEGKECFLESGGERFSRVPCLNASPGAVELYRDLCADAALVS